MNPEQPPVVKHWPRWAVSPEGNRAIFDCPGDIPPGWVLEVPLPGAKPLKVATISEPKSGKVKKAADE